MAGLFVLRLDRPRVGADLALVLGCSLCLQLHVLVNSQIVTDSWRKKEIIENMILVPTMREKSKPPEEPLDHEHQSIEAIWIVRRLSEKT